MRSQKIVKKRARRALERGPRVQMAPGQAYKLQEDENHGSATPLECSLGSNLKAKHGSEEFQKGF